ncbi:MAG: hypothetical protein AAF441_03575 [Pseudomonadota bacterium]
MVAPREADFDLLNVMTTFAIMLSLVAGAILAIAGEQAKLHLLLKFDGAVTSGEIVKPLRLETLYKFAGPDGKVRQAQRYVSDPSVPHEKPGGLLNVYYVNSDPDQFAAEFELPGVETNFNMALVAILAALVSIIACTFAWLRRYRLREKLKRY